MARMPRKHVRQTFFVQHRNGYTQTKQQIGRRCVGEKSILVSREHRLPCPKRFEHAGVFADRQGFFRERIKTEPRRQHQAFLRSTHCYVSAPLVMVIINGRKGGDGINQKQRGMVSAINRRSNGGNAAHYTGRRFVVNRSDRFDVVTAIFRKPRLDLCRIDTVTPIAWYPDDIQP